MLILRPPCTFPPAEITDFQNEFLRKKEKIHGSEGLHHYSASSWLKKRPWLKLPGNFVFFSYDTKEDWLVGCIRCTTHISTSYVLNGAYNIGYSIRPSMREQGFGKEQLRLGLDFLSSFGDEQSVMLTARLDNIASQKTIQACGGYEVRRTNEDIIYRIDFDRNVWGDQT